MASTTWLSERPSWAAARCAAARSAWSILIVRCGRKPAALAIRRCGNGGGGSQLSTCSRSCPDTRRRTRACTACGLMPRASASGRSGQPASVSAASVADSRSLRPDERSSHSRAATRSGSTGLPADLGTAAGAGDTDGARWRCTYCRRPWVTTSDIVRPSRVSRARSRCRCSVSSRKVSSRRGPCVLIPRPPPRPPPQLRKRRRQARSARPRSGPGSGGSRRHACAGSSRAAGP
jgi:hypothetical protein